MSLIESPLYISVVIQYFTQYCILFYNAIL